MAVVLAGSGRGIGTGGASRRSERQDASVSSRIEHASALQLSCNEGLLTLLTASVECPHANPSFGAGAEPPDGSQAPELTPMPSSEGWSKSKCITD